MCILWSTWLVLCFAGLNSASDCFYSENIECSCDDDSAGCSGFQRDPLEVQNMLLNLSNIYSSKELLSLNLNIKNLTFPVGFSFSEFKLQNLSLGNDLESVREDLLSGLSSTLTSLSLEFNNIPFMDNRPFSQLHNLKVLKLDYNELDTINSDVFLNLSKLEFLSLSGNRLLRVDADLLVNLPAIRELVLSNNNLSSLTSINIVSSTVIKLVVQNCSTNGSLTKEFLSGATNLEEVDFSANQLSGVDSYAMSELSQLKRLNLSGNLLEKLEQNAFSSLYNLESLDLKNNKLSIITKTSFLNLTNLRYLDISGNNLEAVLSEYTSDLHSLENVNLRNNNIKIIMPGTFSTSPNLQKLFLKGNTWDCICELSYFVGYLANNSHTIDIEDVDELKCASPANLRDTPLVDVDFIPLNCDNKEETEEEEDYDYETETTEAGVTHSNIAASNFTDGDSTTELKSTTTPSVLLFTTTTEKATEASTATQITTVHPTTEKATASIATEKATAASLTTEITTVHPTTEITTASIATEITVYPTIEKATAASTATEITTVHPTTERSALEIGTTTEKTTPSTEIEKTIWASTTENVRSSTVLISSTKENPITTTEREDSLSTRKPTVSSSTIPIEITTALVPKVASDLSIKIIGFTILDKDFCIRWSASGFTSDKPTCSVKLNTKEGSKSTNLKCPTDGNEIRQCVSSMDIYEFCVNIYVKAVRKSKACSKVTIPTTTKVTEASAEPTTTFVGTEKSKVTIPTTTKVTEASTEPTSAFVGTEKSVDPTTTDRPVPFQVTKFDVIFHYSNSTVLLKWTVNKNEPESTCKLEIVLAIYNYNRTEGIFRCSNNSFQIKNIREQDNFRMCLVVTYKTKRNSTCESYAGLTYGVSGSRTKDDGYKNSSLIAVLCLLVVVTLIIVVIILKNLLKKRIEADRYNVYEQEQNVQKRTSSQFPQEPCVRYSYTLKEQREV